MNLRNKKELAIRTLKIGKRRIIFVDSRKEEIKEAITKQDIRDLVESGAIVIREIKGKKKIGKKKKGKGPGNVKKKVNKRKQEYVIMTRKLRGYSKEMLGQGKITKDDLKEIRKKIRNKMFRSKAHLKSYIEGLGK